VQLAAGRPTGAAEDWRAALSLNPKFIPALHKLATLLAGEGSGLGEVVKATVFLRHMRDFDIMNEVWVAAFGDHRPARTTVAVAELPLHALVEIDAWSYPRGL
jgi:2-iminobutanoate/2-iminopropanoate deaminase